MLAKSEINALPSTQHNTQLLVCIQEALRAVIEPAPSRSSDPTCWAECQVEAFKRQAPGSIILMTDGTFRYVPPGKGSVRGPTDTLELEVRLSTSFGQGYGHLDSGQWPHSTYRLGGLGLHHFQWQVRPFRQLPKTGRAGSGGSPGG